MRRWCDLGLMLSLLSCVTFQSTYKCQCVEARSEHGHLRTFSFYNRTSQRCVLKHFICVQHEINLFDRYRLFYLFSLKNEKMLNLQRDTVGGEARGIPAGGKQDTCPSLLPRRPSAGQAHNSGLDSFFAEFSWSVPKPF